MRKQIVIVDGHPDANGARFCHALANAYAEGAAAAGHSVQRIVLAEMAVPFLRSAEDWAKDDPPPDIRQAQRMIAAAAHLVIIYPLWLGTMPALLKAFLEQLTRGGFAVKEPDGGGWPRAQLKGRSARIIVTMGMPALVYRWYFLAHSLRSLERNILAFAGIGPIRDTLIGGVDALGTAGRERWLSTVRALGEAAR
jgi:putative NADPH-quinone reductase